MTSIQQQVLTAEDLLTPEGHLRTAGYATSLCARYDRSAIRAGKLRIKEWDYYCITSGHMALCLTIADNSYMGLDSASLIDLSTGWQHTQSFMRMFPMGKTGLPATSKTGNVSVQGKGYRLQFENNNGQRQLTAHIDQFYNGQPLDAVVTLFDEPQDSMVIAVPFADKPLHFYYNQKINCLRAQGRVTLGSQVHNFDPMQATAVLDWGRGVWTYRNTWYWSSLSGYIGGAPFGFNLGYGFGDTSAATENMLFYRGKAHKLDQVTFHIPATADGRDGYLLPWRISDNLGRVNLTFAPVVDRAALTDFKLLKSDQHQVFGHFDGTVVLDDGTVLTLPHLMGFAEKVTNWW